VPAASSFDQPVPEPYSSRGIAGSTPTDEERGLAGTRSVPDESALERWARSRGYALDFVPPEQRALEPKPVPDEDGLKQKVESRGYKLDFDPQYTYRADTPAPERSTAKKGGGRSSSVEAVQSDPRLTVQLNDGPGSGLHFVGSRSQNFASRETIQAIETVGREWEERRKRVWSEEKPHEPPRIRVGGIGKVYGGPLETGRLDERGLPKYHKSHQVGVDVDVRPMRKDWKESDVDWRDRKNYSRELTREVIKLFINQNRQKIKVVYFNDEELIKEGLVERQSGHDDHFHVRFLRSSR
jgi:hypothetical protein